MDFQSRRYNLPPVNSFKYCIIFMDHLKLHLIKFLIAVVKFKYLFWCFSQLLLLINFKDYSAF